jgi:hypothetical protein
MAASRIENPITFAEWVKTKALFEEGATKTETYVTAGHEPGARYAYGKSSAGWCFYITMTPAEEPHFWQAYHEWLARNAQPENCHVATHNLMKPPNCGTPNTPECEAVAPMPAPKIAAGQGVKAA